MSEKVTDAAQAEPQRPPSLLDRLLPPVEQLDADGHVMPSRMTRREQLVAAGLGFANVAIVAATATGIESQQALFLLTGLLASAATVVSAKLGNRLVAMAGLFASTLLRPGSTAIFFALVIPYYAAFVWMFLRYNRLTKAKSIRVRQQRLEARAARTGTTKPSGGARKAASPSSGKARPGASKRYTPPKAKKRRPAPSKPPPDRSILD